jgi:hypothetical protein
MDEQVARKLAATLGVRLSWRAVANEHSTGRYFPRLNIIAVRAGADPLGRTHGLLHELAHAMCGHGWHNDEWESIAVRLWREHGLAAGWVAEREEFYGNPLKQWLEDGSYQPSASATP